VIEIDSVKLTSKNSMQTGLNPVWNHVLKFEIPEFDRELTKIKLTCIDDLVKGGIIGETILSLNSVINKQPQPYWIALYDLVNHK
jgi:C2 domain